MKTLAFLTVSIFSCLQIAYSQEINFTNDSDTLVFIGNPHFETEKPLNIKFKKVFPADFNMKIILSNKTTTIRRWEVSYQNDKWLMQSKKDTFDLDRLYLPDKKSNIFILTIKDTSVVKLTFQFTQSGKVVAIMATDSLHKKKIVSGTLEMNKGVSEAQNVEGANEVVGTCTIANPALRYFIPPVPVTTLNGETECVECLNDYKIVYDLSSPETKICYFKKEECTCKSKPDSTTKDNQCKCTESKKYFYVPMKKIRPRVGANVGFHFFGYYPYYDSVGTSFNFESRNLELRDAFAAVTTPTSKTANKPDSTAPKEVAEVTGLKLSQIENDKLFFTQMKKEFGEYFNYLLISSPDMALVQGDVDYINSKLSQYCLAIREFSQKGLFSASEVSLFKYDKEDTDTKRAKSEILNLARQASFYYGLIINYHSVKVPVVQMKNEDQFQWTLDFYKSKKKIDTRTYTMLVSGGWKIDFSSGFALNSLVDKKYSILYGLAGTGIDNKIDSAQIIRQNEGKWLVDIALLAHVYPRTGTRFNSGITSGVVIRNGTSVKYLLGGSLMLGYEQRFVISYGLSMGYTDILDPTYNRALNTYIDKSLLTSLSSSVPTIREFKFGTFFSVSYNLGGTTLGAKQKE